MDEPKSEFILLTFKLLVPRKALAEEGFTMEAVEMSANMMMEGLLHGAPEGTKGEFKVSEL